MKTQLALAGAALALLTLAPNSLALGVGPFAHGVYVDFDGIADYTFSYSGGCNGSVEVTMVRAFLNGDVLIDSFAADLTCVDTPAGTVYAFRGTGDHLTAVGSTATGLVQGQVLDGVFSARLG